MKILHLIYAIKISGAEKYLKHLLPGLHKYGIDAHLIIVCPKESIPVLSGLAEELNQSGVPTNIISARRPGFLLAANKISRYCKKHGIEIIHSHLVNTDLIAVLSKRLFNKKLSLISTKHGYDERVLEVYDPVTTRPKKDMYYHVTRFLQRSIDKNIAVSKGIADLYINLGLTNARFPVIHHGIDVPHFIKDDYKECRRADMQLIIVGRIEKLKGHYFLLQAMQKVVKVFPNIKLVILGEGSTRKQLEDQVDAFNLGQNVDFIGFQPHPYSYISNSDVVILPSHFEAFGLVYIEAFALKVPVIAFDTAAGNEIMENDVTALMVPKGDSEQLAVKIIYLLQHPEERRRLSEAAYEVYKAKFSTSTMIKNTADWYHNNFNDSLAK